jgi:hypothetical protein
VIRVRMTAARVIGSERQGRVRPIGVGIREPFLPAVGVRQPAEMSASILHHDDDDVIDTRISWAGRFPFLRLRWRRKHADWMTTAERR